MIQTSSRCCLCNTEKLLSGISSTWVHENKTIVADITIHREVFVRQAAIQDSAIKGMLGRRLLHGLVAQAGSQRGGGLFWTLDLFPMNTHTHTRRIVQGQLVKACGAQFHTHKHYYVANSPAGEQWHLLCLRTEQFAHPWAATQHAKGIFCNWKCPFGQVQRGTDGIFGHILGDINGAWQLSL